jgi:hypothetical protein
VSVYRIASPRPLYDALTRPSPEGAHDTRDAEFVADEQVVCACDVVPEAPSLELSLEEQRLTITLGALVFASVQTILWVVTATFVERWLS